MIKKIFKYIKWFFEPSPHDRKCAEACRKIQSLKIEYAKNPNETLKNEIKRLEKLCEEKYTDG